MNAKRVLSAPAILALASAVSLAVSTGQGDDKPASSAAKQGRSDTIELTAGLALPPVGRGGRVPVQQDALAAQMATGTYRRPKAGDAIKLPNGQTRKWEPIKADSGGAFSHASLRGGYLDFTVPSQNERIMILEASGHSTAYVNGEPRAGDPYSRGHLRLPVLLRPGNNDLLFQVSRGSLKAKLLPPKAEAYFDLGDPTVPDLIVGEIFNTWAAVVVVNATRNALDDLFLQAACADGPPAITKVYSVPPLSIRKVAFVLQGPAPKKEGTCHVNVKLVRATEYGPRELDTASLNLSIRRPEQTQKRTFVSSIDDSVQYFSLVPAHPATAPKASAATPRPGLVLTLHGAAVEASGQAACFAPKSWVHIVAPTNRRPFGFDWEDWGRLDAMEVLDLTEKGLHTDPRKTYLTGHSMGGHGAWHLGVTYPDRFAAIGPSAGWISMWSYAGARRPENPDPMQEMLYRAALPSDTLALAHNSTQEGVYILHGDKDDNVPVAQARTMVKRLADFHRDFVYHEQAGAGHWWGNACVDWPPMFEFFTWHTLPEPGSVRQVDFSTASPGVSACCHWACIEAQIHPFMVSTIHLNYDPGKRAFSGTTDNVARLGLDLSHFQADKPLFVEVDGQKLGPIPWPQERAIWLERHGKSWMVVSRPAPFLKRPERYGPFKEAFRNRVQFVYGTKGTPEENASTYARARYDAETFYYRGNASVDVLADSLFNATAEPDRNVVLYGNADTNSAWSVLLADSPVQVRRGIARMGDQEGTGEDLGCLFIHPRPGSDHALVGVVSWTGFPGMAATEHLPYFVSGVGYPDCLIVGADALQQGAAGVRVAGFFGIDWGLASGEFIMRRPPPKPRASR